MNAPWTHGTARVHYTARIGEGSKIWADAQIDRGATIGKNCVIGVGAQIGPGVTIGDNCKIQSHALIYSGVTIGNNVFIGPNVVTTNDKRPKATGDWSDRFRETIIQDGVAIGANSTILCGITLGRHCEIGAGCVVTKDCEPYGIYYNPNTAALLMRKADSLTTGTDKE